MKNLAPGNVYILKKVIPENEIDIPNQYILFFAKNQEQNPLNSQIVQYFLLTCSHKLHKPKTFRRICDEKEKPHLLFHQMRCGFFTV